MSNTNDSKSRRIVVGVDGSSSSIAALRWAITESELTGDTVEALMAWQHPIATGGYAWAPLGMVDSTDMHAMAEKTLTEAIEQVAQPGGAVTVEWKVVEGYAPRVLVDASAHADLLVVGSRGHGTFTEALIGSVSQNCAHHAKCPVVIVRGRS